MFIFYNNAYVIDPNMLSILVLRKIWDRDTHPQKLTAKAQLRWLHAMYHPLSTFREYKNSEKNAAIRKHCFEPNICTNWDEDADDDMQKAIQFYTKHVNTNALWYTYESYKEAAYNLGDIVRNKDSSASDIAKARQELDVLPKSMKRMKTEAENEDKIVFNKVAGEKDIKRGERLPSGAQR